MGFEAKILADSYSPDGVRLTTMSVSYPRIIHGETLRHRVFSRCAASSRAIPVQRFIDQVVNDPYVPTHWGRNQPGMQAEVELLGQEALDCEKEWLIARDHAVAQATKLLELGLHKQMTNRLLEPFQWMTEVITATEWDNFFHLRIHKDAHPDIRRIACLMQTALLHNKGRNLTYSGWHLPLVTPDDVAHNNVCDLKKISVGRVARVSYLRHDDTSDAAKDIERAGKMLEHGHMSPFEHVARPMNNDELEYYASKPVCPWNGPPYAYHGIPFLGNFCGWVQYRKEIANEHDLLGQ